MGLRSQNNPIASFRDVFSATGKDAVRAAPPGNIQGITATGGVISDYTEGSKVYRAHIFTSTGELDVTELGTLPAEADFVVVGGGGAGGSDPGNNGAAGGGGAGGYRSSMPEGPGGPSPSVESKITLSVQPYTITVGGGGASTGSPGVPGAPGSPSTFSTITSQGGGGGGAAYVSTGPWNGDGRGGGSGGGAASQNTTSQVAGYGSRVTGPDAPAPNQGYPGGLGHSSGTGTNTQRSGGGGGASAAGIPATSGTPTNGGGGSGKTSAITGSSVNYAGGGTASNDSTQVPVANNPGSPYGGGSSGNLPTAAQAALGGSGYVGVAGTHGTGGGGAGNGWDAHPDPYGLGGSGGSGIVVVRYQIGQLTATAKATGGNVSFYDGKTIHTFTSSGTFTVPGTFNETIRYAAIGGGGGGGVQHGGGGGAGGYRTADIPLNAAGSTVNVSVVIGAGGAGMGPKGSLVGTAGGENNGNDTVVSFPSPVTAGKGGGGGQLGPGPGSPAGVGASVPLGSGGGGGLHQPGNSANNFGTAGPNGNPGGRGSTYGENGHGGVGGGGGGIGGAGGSGQDANPYKGKGGVGVQLHPFFRNPAAAPSATTPTEPRFAGERGGGLGTPGPNGQFYVGGGGGGGGHTPWGFGVGPNKAGGDGGFGGGGHGGINTPVSEPQYHPGTNAVANTGGGGGGAGPHTVPGGSGGSGIVLIAYPT